jgi:fructose-1,6-bisphosphatase
MFGTWTNRMGGKIERQLLTSASAFYWTIWLGRNDIVFDKAHIKYFFRYYTEEHIECVFG